MEPGFWESRGWIVVLAIFAVLGATALLLRRRALAPPVVIPPEQLARESLLALRERGHDVDLALEVSHIMRRYIYGVLSLPPSELTTSELRQKLRDQAVFRPSLAEEIGGFLQTCDGWKFAPAPVAMISGGPVAELGNANCHPKATGQTGGVTLLQKASELVEKVEASRVNVHP